MQSQQIQRLCLALTISLVLLAFGCDPPSTGNPQGPTPPTPNGTQPPVAAQVRYLKQQGWSDAVRDRFHYTSQGSELLPYYWFLLLEKPGSSVLFKDELKNYGFLFEPASSDPRGLNPDGLPIGFAKSVETEKLAGVKETEWAGLTCAACHTGAITYKANPSDTSETLAIIDGAPTSADLGGFLQDLGAAVAATNAEPAKLRAFADRVVGQGHGTSASEVESQFHLFAQELAKIVKLATPTHPWGPGRVDAFGVIFNRVCNYDLPGASDMADPPDAPVSYPFLWYSDRQDHVQWHGEVDNRDWLHRLGRNAGEVAGVFARIDMRAGAGSYLSSVDPDGLGLLDDYVTSLKSPAWNDVLPPPIKEEVDHGRQVFVNNCQKSCHADVVAAGRRVKITPVPLSPGLKTDEEMTVRLHKRRASTGDLAGTFKFIVPGPVFGTGAPAAEIVANATAGALIDKAGAVHHAYIRHLLSGLPFGPSGPTFAVVENKAVEKKAAVDVNKQKIAGAYKVSDPAATS